jgi:hypothetical protein
MVDLLNPEMGTMYRVHFLIDGVRHAQDTFEGIAEFKDGFWINTDCEHTKKSDARFWIPPHQVVCIEKLKGFGE